MNADKISETISRVLEQYDGELVFAYLFGSAATDSTGPLSDIDIAIYIQDDLKKSFYDLKLSVHADMCRALGRNDIDIVVLNITTNLILLDEIVRNGIVLFDKDSTAREEFELKVQHEAIDFRQQRKALMDI